MATAISADDITLKEFQRRLALYPSTIELVSAAKNVKNGQKTLLELDHYRYDDAPDLFSPNASGSGMGLDAIKTLVEWKLRHGKFRPTLMSLVSSNSPGLVGTTVGDAIARYREEGNVSSTIDALTKLKGIGPATASLLLSVHDSDHVIFFSDEAFFWLCRQGKKVPIKYNAKEYRELCQAADTLRERLGVSAMDIEKVAFALMRQPSDGDQLAPPITQPIGSEGSEAVPVKRKANSTSDSGGQQTIRRSKRNKS